MWEDWGCDRIYVKRWGFIRRNPMPNESSFIIGLTLSKERYIIFSRMDLSIAHSYSLRITWQNRPRQVGVLDNKKFMGNACIQTWNIPYAKECQCLWYHISHYRCHPKILNLPVTRMGPECVPWIHVCGDNMFRR
jgi:hypothetical protein